VLLPYQAGKPVTSLEQRLCCVAMPGQAPEDAVKECTIVVYTKQFKGVLVLR
jgi:hypothetical protein